MVVGGGRCCLRKEIQSFEFVCVIVKSGTGFNIKGVGVGFFTVTELHSTNGAFHVENGH